MKCEKTVPGPHDYCRLLENVLNGISFVDMDRFTKFNDGHGHEMGNAVLKAVARTLRASARSYDLLGRWEGEEFIGIIRNIGRKGLTTIADRHRRLIERSQVRIGHDFLGVTVSMGATLGRKATPSNPS